VGYALYTTHERPFFFNQSISTGKNFFRFEAKNVKVISANGDVTLRGPVKTKKEKSRVAARAKAIAGVDRVDNQLEVKSTQ